MQQFLLIHRLNNTDINMYQCGTQDCEPGHAYGPAVRDHFLIHYIHSGRGIFRIGGREYKLQSRQGFLICPDIITYYQADFEDPWSYSWVGFHGLKAETYLKSAGLTMNNPIFTCNDGDYMDDYFSRMIAAKNLQSSREIHLLGLLYLFLSQLIEQNGKGMICNQADGRKETYIKKAIEYIEMNYSRKMTISELAQHLNLDRSYLGFIFKEQLGNSLQNFLINYRIGKACELMKNESLTIGDISRSVGYDDPLQFSKIFKKNRGISPRAYKKSYRNGIG